MHAAFVAGEIWGFMLEPARSQPERVNSYPRKIPYQHATTAVFHGRLARVCIFPVIEKIGVCYLVILGAICPVYTVTLEWKKTPRKKKSACNSLCLFVTTGWINQPWQWRVMLVLYSDGVISTILTIILIPGIHGGTYHNNQDLIWRVKIGGCVGFWDRCGF